MIIIDRELLAEFSAPGRCEWCSAPGPRQAHHIQCRGMGGGSRLDVRINLISLCMECHMSHHSGNLPLTLDLTAIVAQREGTTQDAILAEIWRLRRLPKLPRLPGRKRR